MTADETLWARASLGDGEAFGIVFDRHRGRVRRHALRLVAVSTDAEDVLAVVFLEAWRKRNAIRFVDGSMLPWLLRTATYTASNLARAGRRHREALQRLPPPEEAASTPSEEAHVDVVAALRTLPLRDQEVITLCVLEDLSAAEAIEEMARSLVHDDTRLFGTPFILAGQGETTVVLGPQPAEATHLAVAFNCHDNGPFDVTLDDERVIRVTCDAQSTPRAGGATLHPLGSSAETGHRLRVDTERSQQYVVWASWAAPAAPPDASTAQHEAMADGIVTEAEYRDGFARYEQCMTDAGFSLGSVNRTGTIITYVNSSDAVQSGVEGRCYAAEFADVDSGWQVANG